MNEDSGFGINIPNPVSNMVNAGTNQYYFALNALITEDCYISAIEFYVNIRGTIWIFVRRVLKCLNYLIYFTFHFRHL